MTVSKWYCGSRDTHSNKKALSISMKKRLKLSDFGETPLEVLGTILLCIGVICAGYYAVTECIDIIKDWF